MTATFEVAVSYCYIAMVHMFKGPGLTENCGPNRFLLSVELVLLDALR